MTWASWVTKVCSSWKNMCPPLWWLDKPFLGPLGLWFMWYVVFLPEETLLQWHLYISLGAGDLARWKWNLNDERLRLPANWQLFSAIKVAMTLGRETAPQHEAAKVTVQYMVAEAQYGGRITDDLDRELFNTYTTKWFCSWATLDSKTGKTGMLRNGIAGDVLGYHNGHWKLETSWSVLTCN